MVVLAVSTESLGREAFDHIGEKFRGKVARDLLALVTTDNQWDFTIFDPHNDYQRHLYGLFLRLAGVPYSKVQAKIWSLCDDVEPNAKSQYVSDVLHSEIVGFPRQDGSLLSIPPQQVEE